MKTQSFWVVIPAVILTLGACNKKEEPANPAAATQAVASPDKAAPPAPATAPATAPPPAPAPATAPATADAKALSAEERAVKLGFARYLPQDTESVISVYNGNKIGDRAQGMKLWKVLKEQIGANLGMERGSPPQPEENMGGNKPAGEDFAIPEGEVEVAAAAAEEEPATEPKSNEEVLTDPMAPGDMLGLEVTFGVGKTAGTQLANLMTLSSRLGYFQMRSLAKAFVAAAKSGDLSGIEESMGNTFGEELAKNLIHDPESGIGLLERANMPPVYLAFRTDKAKHDAVAGTVSEMVGNLQAVGEMVEAVEFESAGAKFSGYKFLGSKIAEEMGTDRKAMDEALGAETADKLLAAIGKKSLVVASGTLGEYVVMFIGSSEKDCHLVAEVNQSLTNGTALAFSDAYASKELAAIVFGNDSAAKALASIQGGLSAYTNGLRDGLAGADGLGDTRDLEALLQLVADREAALRKLGGMEAMGTVAFFEQGLKVEAFGGYDPGALDWKTPAKLSHLGDSPDVAMFANLTSDAAYDEKARAYYESVVETAYALAMKVSDLKWETGEMKQFKEMAGLFNGKFRADVVALWDALKGDLASGLGQETAIVIDLKGTVPAIPGLPQPFVDKGRFPRATMISPVTDRAKLASSWTKMNETCTKLLAKVSEMSGKKIPMQKPLSSEKDGYKTWFMAFPFLNDDFVPSVTVGDKWFAASTSKNRALELLGAADKGTAGRTGLWMKMDFKAMQEATAETLKLLDDNAEAIFGKDSAQLAKFKSSKGLRDKVIDAMSELDSLTVHSRRENAVLRSSVHFKTR